MISKKLCYFLRQTLPDKAHSKIDGGVDTKVISQSLGFKEDDLLLVTHPAFGDEADEGMRKRRFAVMEYIFPNKHKVTKIGALGGHSCEVMAPPGHYILAKESISQLGPIVHHTCATREIIEAGYLCQQRRKGGINFSTGKNVYRERATHAIEVDADSAMKLGYTFFGNRFSDVVFAPGKWEQGQWGGKIPLKFLTISLRK